MGYSAIEQQGAVKGGWSYQESFIMSVPPCIRPRRFWTQRVVADRVAVPKPMLRTEEIGERTFSMKGGFVSIGGISPKRLVIVGKIVRA